MSITAINSINGASPLASAGEATGTAALRGGGDGSFGSLVKGAVESLGETQKAAEGEIAKAVTGQSPDLHKTIIALQTADLKFQLGLQVRNKLIGAYDEIMRMQV